MYHVFSMIFLVHLKYMAIRNTLYKSCRQVKNEFTMHILSGSRAPTCIPHILYVCMCKCMKEYLSLHVNESVRNFSMYVQSYNRTLSLFFILSTTFSPFVCTEKVNSRSYKYLIYLCTLSHSECYYTKLVIQPLSQGSALILVKSNTKQLGVSPVLVTNQITFSGISINCSSSYSWQYYLH